MATQISRDPNFYSQAGQEAGQFGYGTLPPEQALTERSIARKQQIANLLMQRGMQQAQPKGEMAGRFYVAPSPWQGGAGLAQILAGAIGSHYLDAKSKEAEQKAQGNRADAFAQYKSQTEDVPAVAGSAPMAAPQAAVADAMAGQQAATPPSMEAQPMQGPSASPSVFRGSYPMGPDESGWEPKGPIQDLNAPSAPQQQVAQAMTPPPPTQGPVSPGTPGRPRTSAEKRQAIMDLIANQDPSVSRIGSSLLQQDEAMQEKQSNREFLHGENQLTRDNQLSMAGSKIDQMMTMGLITQALGKQMKDELIASNERMNKSTNESRENVARIGAEAKTDVAGMKVGQKGALPATALKLRQEELDTIGMASGLNADLKALDEQVSSGKLKLGMVENLAGMAKNFAGISDEQSRNLATFKATLEKQRNDSLRLNKGVQTEGDAQRAWNELIANINDPKLVSQRLKEIQTINQRAVDIKKLNVDAIHKNYGQDPFDFEGYTTQPAAPGSGTVAPFDDAEKERRYQEFKATHK